MGKNVKSGGGPFSAARQAPAGGGGGDVFSQTMVLENVDVNDALVPEKRLQPGSMLRDRYLLQQRVAAGSLGAVYKAFDRHLADDAGDGSLVAIKVLTARVACEPDALRTLQQEAAKSRCLSHPNILRVIDLDREDDLYFLVMEWLDGQSLEYLLENGSLSDDLPRMLDILRQLGEGLSYAHRRGVIHADVKPANVIVHADGTAKLVDFGLARLRQALQQTRFDTVLPKSPTPAYSSMQVLTGEEPVAADDVFSLACLAYRMIAGHRVFGPRNAAEAAEAGMEPQRPQNLGDAQWKALRKGLAYARVARQQSPQEFVDELMQHKSPPKVRTASPSPSPPPQADDVVDKLVVPAEDINERRFDRRHERRSAVWPAVLLALLLGGAALAFLRPDWRAVAEQHAREFIDRVRAAAADGAGAGSEAAVQSPPVTAAAEPGDESAAAPQAAPAARRPASGTAERSSAAAKVPAAALPADRAPDRSASSAPVDDDRPPAGEVPTPGAGAASDPGRPAPITSGKAASLVLVAPGGDVPEIALQLNEDGVALGVELYRLFDLAEPLLVRIDEVGFSGNRSPREEGVYTLSDDGVVSFEPGQRRATLTIRPDSNDRHEPDRQVSLLLRDYYSAESVLGRLELRLLDDDQRRYEAGMPANTVAFTDRRALVAERDPAVQLEVLRFNPDQTSMSVRYDVVDVSASEGQDYFVPSQRFVTFGPGQRNARLLIPLVQDNVPEGDESFIIELDADVSHGSMIGSVAVTIEDDDSLAE